MRLTVLGKSPSWQDADGACSGYLLEDDEPAAIEGVKGQVPENIH